MPDFRLEDGLRLPAGARIAGVDEVGRGPLAGPVTAAAVVLNRRRCPAELLSAIDDSKRLSAPRREVLARALPAVAAIGIGWVERAEIDRLNILWATMLAMRRAIDDLIGQGGKPVDFVLIDGNRVPDLDGPAMAVVKGDTKSLSIAAASIVAKVARDARMIALAHRHPGYGWERNAGYGTPEHLAALSRLGPTPEHRRGFAPVRAALEARAGRD
jgi:ribonuclease HII